MKTNLGLWVRNRSNTAWGEEDIEARTTAKRSRGQQLLRRIIQWFLQKLGKRNHPGRSSSWASGHTPTRREKKDGNKHVSTMFTEALLYKTRKAEKLKCLSEVLA